MERASVLGQPMLLPPPGSDLCESLLPLFEAHDAARKFLKTRHLVLKKILLDKAVDPLPFATKKMASIPTKPWTDAAARHLAGLWK